MNQINLSIVIPLLNEEESLKELTSIIVNVCNEASLTFEILLIDDGSTDSSWSVIKHLSTKDNRIKGVSFRRNYGKSAALNTGFSKSVGNVVITMDADLQDNPNEIPELYNLIVEEKYDIISGWKKNRKDPLSKTIPTKLYNSVTRMVSGIKLNDMNCGLKAYRSEVVKSIEVYGEMHRYIPVIAKWAGFNKIGEKVVIHSERKYGKTKFGFERFIFGFLDLFSITFIGKFGKRPMHLFGSLGIIMFFVAFIFLFWIGIDKLFIDTSSKLIADRTEFFIAITAMIMGVQMFLAGFIGEMISRNSPKRNFYQIKEEIG